MVELAEVGVAEDSFFGLFSGAVVVMSMAGDSGLCCRFSSEASGVGSSG